MVTTDITVLRDVKISLYMKYIPIIETEGSIATQSSTRLHGVATYKMDTL
jgi:hypothetical protein